MTKQRRHATYRLGLERLNSLDLRAHVVRDGLELVEELLRLVHDRLVLEHRAVVREVDGGRLSVELGLYPLCVRVALAEGLQGGDGLCTTPHISVSVSLSTINVAFHTLAETQRRVDASEVLVGEMQLLGHERVRITRHLPPPWLLL